LITSAFAIKISSTRTAALNIALTTAQEMESAIRAIVNVSLVSMEMAVNF
jgi:hypothetical protein